MSWRVFLKIHPAAELFPLMTEAELRELAEDIKTNGLRAPIVGWAGDGDQLLLDGRNRLDAMALLGLLYETDDHHVGVKKWTGKQWSERPGGHLGYASGCEFKNFYDGDPYAIALSLNVHRRHLTNEQKRDLIAKLLKLDPGKSDRQIGEMAKVSHTTVAKARNKAEARGDVAKVATRTDTKGRQQAATKQSTKTAPPEKIPERKREFVSVGNGVDPELSAEARRAEMAALAETEAITPKAPVASRDKVVDTIFAAIITITACSTRLLPNEFLNSLSLDALKALAPDLHRVRQWLDEADDATRSHLRNEQSRPDLRVPNDLSVPDFLKRAPETVS
jgi:hypothetical protein